MMKQNLKLIIITASVCLIVLGALFAYGSVLNKKGIQMIKVGGHTNQCACTQRIEQ